MNKGFTLAEVLITLGVIGVVAALTLPTLIKEYQKTVLVNQLKHSVSTIEQGFKKMLADEGVDSLEDTSYYIKARTELKNGECAVDQYNTDAVCKEFFDNLKQYFNISDIKDAGEKYIVKNIDGSIADDAWYTSGTKIFFNNGLLMWFYNINDSRSGISGLMTIDVNGLKAPNTIGRDIFYFDLGSQGNLKIPDCSHMNDISDLDTINEPQCSSYWIVTNGWKMDY